MIRVEVQQGSDAWFALKCARITGTRFSSVMAAKSTDKYKKLVSCMVGEILRSDSEDTFKSSAMEDGVEREPDAIKEYEVVTGYKISQTGMCVPDQDHPLHEWIGISPDLLIGDDGGAEFKCPTRATHIDYILSNELPSEYKWQVYGELMVAEREWWDFVSYYPGEPLFIKRVFKEDVFKERNSLFKGIEDIVKIIKDSVKRYKEYKPEIFKK
jgi:hypothetical protein